ncbi:MAG: sulfatase [Bacteroidota bacterium]|nr:sulfatase [Bacteroidota bacterium]MDE2835478.1 sulfatase [Bacteroidota bacterium]
MQSTSNRATLTRRDFIKAATCAAALGACRQSTATGPNIVFIFADDLGYNDLGCYGSETIRTPHLDRLAAEGLRFTDFRSLCSVCSPSRAALLTGRYPSRCGVPFAVGGVYSDLGLQESEVTVAELVREAGYRTACIGKWHLGIPSGFDFRTHSGFTARSEFHPARHGFDLFFGMVGNSSPDGSTPLLEDDAIVDPDAHVTTITEHFTHRAIEFIRAEPQHPFLIYLSHTRAHAPWMPNPRFAGGSPAGVYGDMVEEIDWSTGQVLAALEQAGLSDDTLVIFTSDNGSAPNTAYGSNRPFRGGKGSTFEGGLRVPCILRWPARIAAEVVSGAMVNAMDLLPTIAGVAGAALPADRVIDGVDLRPILLEGGGMEDRIFYYYNGLNLQAVREGRWKLHLPRSPQMLVWWESGIRDLDAPLLYDLRMDPGETQDLAAAHPDIVDRLTELAARARAELGAWDQAGTDQRAIMHLMDDRKSLRHLRSQQGHQAMGRNLTQ